VPIEVLTDSADVRLSGYRDLTDVALRVRFEPDNGVYIAESASVIERAVASGHVPYSILMEDKWLPRMRPLLDDHPEIPVYVADKQLLEEITGFHVHRGALALMHRPELPTLDDVLTSASRLLILEDIVDHTNVGAIVRSAAGLGFDGFLVTPRCADPLYRRSVRVSMGTVFDLPWTRIAPWPDSLAHVREAGFTVVGMTPGSDSIDLDAVTAPNRVALVLGTEGDGLTTAAIASCDVSVRIPMRNGVDSLNVAAAAAIVCWHFRPSGE
jgi:tRNA G18 (ribose-2'-O)-methylase SpoU